jgi:peptidoglycan/xylan/chitin deacetylase (PgdA/CDA1 family)
MRLFAGLALALLCLFALPAPVPAQDVRVPVVMYHEIGDGPDANWLEEKRFAEQVRWLAQNGYRAVTLSEAYDYVRGAKKPPAGAKPIALTFDDGYASFYTKAVPLLRRYGFAATVCVITGQVGRGNHVTWGQLKKLAAAGFEVASHTASHPDLRYVGKKRLAAEVAGSKKILEERLGVPVRFFCYPAGKYNAAVLRAVREAGYAGALTTKPGVASASFDPYLWSRIRAYRGMSLKSFAAALRK